MPRYEFEYTSETGEVCRFDQTIPLDDYDSIGSVKSPCGLYPARRVFGATPTHYGLNAAAKRAGVPMRRIEFGKYAVDQRERRKREHGPGTREGDSNELWTGKEDLRNVVSPKA